MVIHVDCVGILTLCHLDCFSIHIQMPFVHLGVTLKGVVGYDSINLVHFVAIMALPTIHGYMSDYAMMKQGRGLVANRT